MRAKKDEERSVTVGSTVRISVRLGPEVVRRLTRLEDHVGRRLGVRASRADVLREALMRGLALLEDGPRGR
jgi:Arc/MetJ-type ribon-helix-helix transcriptional regulator